MCTRVIMRIILNTKCRRKYVIRFPLDCLGQYKIGCLKCVVNSNNILLVKINYGFQRMGNKEIFNYEINIMISPIEKRIYCDIKGSHRMNYGHPQYWTERIY